MGHLALSGLFTATDSIPNPDTPIEGITQDPIKKENLQRLDRIDTANAYLMWTVPAELQAICDCLVNVQQLVVPMSEFKIKRYYDVKYAEACLAQSSL